MPVQFTHSSGTVTFTRAPLHPLKRRGYIQPGSSSTGGHRVTGAAITKAQYIELRWTSMPRADLDALLTFWQSVARGSARQFTFTDVAGASQAACFADANRPQFREKAYNSFEVSCRLRVF